MRIKKVTVIIEASSTGYGAYSEQLTGITGYGKNAAEAKKDLQSAFQETLEAYDGVNVPAEFNNGNIEFTYKYDIASIFDHFPMLDATNFAKKIGMNPSLLRQYKGGHTLAGDKQKEKIEIGLHELGRELLSVRL
jgi:predicted RNase H-like HicB family nuclease